jgi:hypothetical protein
VTKSGYPYPPDEFDVAVPGGAPVGVHRAPRSGWSSAWPFLLVAVVCAAVAWGGITLLSGGDDPAEASGGGASPSASASASASGEPSVEPSGGASEPSSSPSTEAQYPGDPTLANKSAETIIGVYNNGGEGMDGMAGTVTTNLEAAGFEGEIHPLNTGAEFGPAPDSVTANTVLYGGDRADTASAVAETLGITPANVKASEEVGAHPTEGIWVIMVTPPTTGG